MKYLIFLLIPLLFSCQKGIEKKNTDSSSSPVQVVKEQKSDIEKKNGAMNKDFLQMGETEKGIILLRQDMVILVVN